MQRTSHAAVTSGLASAASALWIRHRIHERHPAVGPIPALQQRIQRRSPDALATLTFTGIATSVAAGFDKFETSILGGNSGHHHDLHTLPFLGSLQTGATLVKQGSHRLANWICGNLGIPDRVKKVGAALRDLAAWILDGAITGAVTHILADLPNSGRGNTALTLLKPFTNKSFDLGWWKHDAPVPNNIALKAGSVLTGASWIVAASYLLTPEPPEEMLYEAVQDARKAWQTNDLQSTVAYYITTIQHRITNDRTDSETDLNKLFSQVSESSNDFDSVVGFKADVDFQNVFSGELISNRART